MKNLMSITNRATLTIVAMLTSMLAFAQENAAKIDVNVNKGGGNNWYANPILWIVGIGVFILLFVALARGNRSDA